MSATTPYQVQKAVMRSLHKEFNAAVEKARKKSLAEAEKTLMTENPPYNSGIRSGFDLVTARHMIMVLQKGAEGYYELPYYSRVSSVDNSHQLWGHYLESIGRLNTSAWGCIPRNEETMIKLLRQNGPKKMEDRLRKFARGRIKETVKNVTRDIGPR